MDEGESARGRWVSCGQCDIRGGRVGKQDLLVNSLVWALLLKKE